MISLTPEERDAIEEHAAKNSPDPLESACAKVLWQLDSGHCDWREDDDGNWETSCDNIHCFMEGGVKENEHKFCPYCGREIKEVPYGSEDA